MGLSIKKFAANKRALSYLGIILVIFLWGISPTVTVFVFDSNLYSPSIYKLCVSIISVIALLIICAKKLKLLNINYLKVAVPTGIFYSIAEVIQKIGLKYTTPTASAFLENLSVVVVPILMFLFVKAKPTILKIIACFVCLSSAFVLSMGTNGSTFGFGIGEILCALAGIFYGVNIAATGVFAKKLDSALYILIQMIVCSIVSAIFAVVLNFVYLPGSLTPIEPIVFTFSFYGIAILVAITLFTSTACWLIRTAAMKHVDATVVAIIMPFSAVITGIASVIVGYDTISLNLILGAVLGFGAIMLSSVSDILQTKKLMKNYYNKNSTNPTQSDETKIPKKPNDNENTLTENKISE